MMTSVARREKGKKYTSPVVSVVVKVRARRRGGAAPRAVEVVQQGREAEGGVGRVGERAAAGVVVRVEVEVVDGASLGGERRASGHREEVGEDLLFFL